MSYKDYEEYHLVKKGWLPNWKEGSDIRSILEWTPPVIRYFLRPTLWWKKDIMHSFAMMIKSIFYDNNDVFIVANTKIGIKDYLFGIKFKPEIYKYIYQFMYL